MVYGQVVRHGTVNPKSAGSIPATPAVSLMDRRSPPKRTHVGSIPTETTSPSSNGRAAVLQTADGSSILSGDTGTRMSARCTVLED